MRACRVPPSFRQDVDTNPFAPLSKYNTKRRASHCEILPKIKVAMYGLTSEAYRLAADLVDRAQVTIIDETLQMALEIEPPFLKRNPNLQDVMSAEPLLS